jgi:hypothetical protein
MVRAGARDDCDAAIGDDVNREINPRVELRFPPRQSGE